MSGYPGARDATGTSIGQAVGTTIVEYHGGNIWIDGERGPI